MNNPSISRCGFLLGPNPSAMIPFASRVHVSLNQYDNTHPMILPNSMVSSSDGSNAFSKGSSKGLLIQGRTETKMIAGPDSSVVSMYVVV
jgi:hypothetical protein